MARQQLRCHLIFAFHVLDRVFDCPALADVRHRLNRDQLEIVSKTAAMEQIKLMMKRFKAETETDL